MIEVSAMKQQTMDSLVAEMIKGVEAVILAEEHNSVIPRFNQVKTIACVDAEFTVHGDIPSECKQGLFARPGVYPATLRFANASNRDDSKKDIRGLSIRVKNVEGPVLWGEPGMQDFLLNSYPALFVATPEEFLAFIRARRDKKELMFFLNPLNPHLGALWRVFKARKHHLSPLDIRYWSTVPSRLGDTGDLIVKYSAIPASDFHTTQVVDPGENQLRSALKAHLRRGEARFQFAIQKRTNALTMPIEDASAIWDERDSPFIPVATITITDQDCANRQALDLCERSSFNPWQCLRAHKPVGRMNEVRRLVYAHAAKLRNKEE